jgi:hypothetical protein
MGYINIYYKIPVKRIKIKENESKEFDKFVKKGGKKGLKFWLEDFGFLRFG